MTEAAVAIPEHSPGAAESASSRVLAPAIAAVSFGSLLLELALTRLFSVVLFYHFAFLAVSVALLGLGAGGVFAYVQRERLARFATMQIAAWVCLVNAVLVVAVLEIILHVPVSLRVTWANLLRLTVIYCAAAVPFFFTGLLFAVVFARETRRIALLYGADLMGGAMACLAIVPALNWLGGPNAVLLAGLAMAGASLMWSSPSSLPSGAPGARRVGMAVALALAALIGANYSGKLFDIVWAKGAPLDQGRLFARWNAISRVEVNQWHYIVIDADATTAMMSTDPNAPSKPDWLMSAPSSTVNVLRPHGHFAIIGPGGGVDVLRAVAAGSPRVVGIEINPLIANTIMRQRFADYSQHLYELPEVELHVSDGRSWVRNSSERFDVLQMTLVDTWASTAAGAFALSENSLYTREAFREYFQHLNADGMLAITRWEFRRPREALRVVSEAMEALHSLGVRDCAAHFVVVSDGALDEDGRPVTVLARRTPFTAGELAAVAAHLQAHTNIHLLYAPGEAAPNPFGELIRSNDPQAFAASYDYNVAPVSDDAPFFFFTMKTGDMLRHLSAGDMRAIDWKVNLGVVVLGALLILSMVALLAFLIAPLALVARARRHAGRGGLRPLLYFVAIGLGYILVEIAFIQRFVLFLGHPTYALTVVVFLMLLSSGAGSLAARQRRTLKARIGLPIVVIVMALVVLRFALQPMLVVLVGLPFFIKLVLTAAVLGPPAFCMGVPFPTGLHLLSLHAAGGESRLEWAWAMNASASVMGSVLAMVVAIHFGLNVTLLAGAAAYCAALALGIPQLERAQP
jgi:hypothetical protein